MKNKAFMWGAMGMAAVFAMRCQAVPLVSESGASLLGWNAELRDLGEPAFMGGTDPIAPVPDVHGSGTPGIQITGGTAPGIGNPPVEDILYDDGGQWTATGLDTWGTKWANGPPLRVEFDFFADANANGSWEGWAADAPNGLSLYIVGANTTWFYDIEWQGAAWSHHLVNLIHGAGWYDALGNGKGESDFENDIVGNVSQIGIRIWYDQEITGQKYGLGSFTLDNEYFVIPEPQTYYSIGIAVLSLGVTFRRRLNDVFATVGRLARG